MNSPEPCALIGILDDGHAGLGDAARHRIAAADLVITGEGSLDFQSLAGKGPAGIASLAAQHHKPVWAICGTADPAARASGLFARIADLTSTGLPIDTLMRDAANLLATLATTTARTA